MNRRTLLAVALLLSAALPVSAQSVSLSLRDGRVTLITQNASPSAILAEWARLGQVTVVDAERVPATPLTLRLENVPEREALDIVLRSAAGYIAAPRAQPVAGAVSRFDRVIVMASSPGASTAARPNSGPTASARVNSPAPFRPQPAQVEEDDADEQQVVTEEAPAMPVAVEQPVSSTNFDYANPQRYFAARQAEQAAEAAQQQQQATPQPSTSPMGSLGQTSARPGVLPMPQPQQDGQTPAGAATGNPYGLPPGQAPGSAAGTSPLEPDRSKYINPYAPTPPRP